MVYILNFLDVCSGVSAEFSYRGSSNVGVWVMVLLKHLGTDLSSVLHSLLRILTLLHQLVASRGLLLI